MENATKALLIAASVLIVILLIAFGMRIFNSTSGTGEQVEGVMQTTEVTMFNNKFMSYIGTGKSKNDVISLLNLVSASNATSNRTISVDISNINSNIANTIGAKINAISKLDSSKKFYAFIPYNTGIDKNGYIVQITIVYDT